MHKQQAMSTSKNIDEEELWELTWLWCGPILSLSFSELGTISCVTFDIEKPILFLCSSGTLLIYNMLYLWEDHINISFYGRNVIRLDSDVKSPFVSYVVVLWFWCINFLSFDQLDWTFCFKYEVPSSSTIIYI